jgi:alcohol dehydrogenase class IV
MAYAVAGLVRDFRPVGYPDAEAMVPHGMSVILNAPATFRQTAHTDPTRHLEAAAQLGASAGDAAPDDAGDVLAEHLIGIMRAVGMPNGLGGVGYTEADLSALTDGAWPQQRLLSNAPIDVDTSFLASTFEQALRYW